MFLYEEKIKYRGVMDLSLNNDEWRYISRHPRITWDIIREHPDKPWHWKSVCLNPNITLPIIQANMDRKWDWSYVCMNPTTSTQQLESILNEKMGSYLFEYNLILTTRDDISTDMLKRMRQFFGDDWRYYSCMFSHPNLDWDVVRNEPELARNYKYGITANPSLTKELIDEFSEYILTEFLGLGHNKSIIPHDLGEDLFFNNNLMRNEEELDEILRA